MLMADLLQYVSQAENRMQKVETLKISMLFPSQKSALYSRYCLNAIIILYIFLERKTIDLVHLVYNKIKANPSNVENQFLIERKI